MANINITELTSQGRDSNSLLLPIMQMPALTVQNVAIGATSVASATFQSQTGVIRVRADAACAVLIGTDPTALITSTMLDANSAEYFSVPIGGAFKLAVIAI